MDRRTFLKIIAGTTSAITIAPVNTIIELVKNQTGNTTPLLKGQSFFDVGYVYAPYIPLQITSPLYER